MSIITYPFSLAFPLSLPLFGPSTSLSRFSWHSDSNDRLIDKHYRLRFKY